MHEMSVNPVFYSVQAPAGLNECSQSINLFISKLIDEMFKCKDWNCKIHWIGAFSKTLFPTNTLTNKMSSKIYIASSQNRKPLEMDIFSSCTSWLLLSSTALSTVGAHSLSSHMLLRLPWLLRIYTRRLDHHWELCRWLPIQVHLYKPYYVQSKLKKVLFLSKYLGKKNYKIWVLMQDSRD